MELESYEKVMSKSREQKEAAMVKANAHANRKQGEVKLADLEIQILDKENTITELCYKKKIDFDAIIKELNQVALLKRTHSQYEALLEKLFPSKKGSK